MSNRRNKIYSSIQDLGEMRYLLKIGYYIRHGQDVNKYPNGGF